MPTNPVEDELIAIAHDWDRAMVQNNPDAIGRYMAEEWVIVGSDGMTMDKRTFLELVRSGTVTHDTMTSSDFTVRVYGSAAIVMCSGVSAGMYQGRPFREVERASNVFVKHEGQWRCVLTHLSRLS